MKQLPPPKQAPKESFYIPLDVAASINEYEDGVQHGETSRIADLDRIFQWMRGYVNGWYGFANDGKGTLLDYLMVIKAKYDGWKFCCFKPEDMDTVKINGKVQIKANRIYKNLAWTLTGKTWSKDFAEKRKGTRMTFDEEQEALQFIRKHFYIIYPEDRMYTSMIDNCRFMYEKFGIDSFLWDPFNEAKLDNEGRDDVKMIEVFKLQKKLAMETNSVFNNVSHPKSMGEVKEKNGAFKVVNQFMQIGGAAWDIKMDGQFSINRPFRHENPRDPRVHLYNLKQRQAEIVGAERGVYKNIVFDPLKKQYYFDGLNPMDGTMTDERRSRMNGTPVDKNTDIFGNSMEPAKPLHKKEPEPAPDEAPF